MRKLPTNMSKNEKLLIIVESPSKTKTISKYVDNASVIASVGHFKDLPKKDMGIDIDNDFAMQIESMPDKKKFLSELKKEVKIADRILIATDPDREGEAIAADIASEIKGDVERVEFTEITKQAVLEAVNNSRKINYDLVDAQRARRAIDRIVGFSFSPVLWKTLRSLKNKGLSAGRVQSVALKLLVDREKLRNKFIENKFYSIDAEIVDIKSKEIFKASLISYDGKPVAKSDDFGKFEIGLKDDTIIQVDKNLAEKIKEECNANNWIINNIESKPTSSSPAPPFTTSTLQQDASRRFGFSPKRTMVVAQKLYEQGFITYMRTDSTNLSNEALSASKKFIKESFGDDFLAEKTNVFKNKVANAQEAHEAIRPAHKLFKSVDEVSEKLGKDAGNLYDLIWKRTIASQMLPAKLKQTSVIISNADTDFRASGQIIVFPGYMKIYVEGKDNPDAELANKEKLLPAIVVNEELICSEIVSQIHKTKPPARFTEASLVKEMEINGIGRPSTFASILDTIVRRGYVEKTKSNLSPTYLGLAITQLLENHFTALVDKDFTAKMENELDAISRGELEPIPFMENFYFGNKKHLGLEKMLEEKVDIGKACTIPLPTGYDDTVEARIGKFGPYLRKEEDTRSIPQNIFVGDLTDDIIDSLFKDQREDEVLGKDPESKEDILLKKGPYGHYVQLGETTKRKAIPKGTEIDSVDLELAIKLISLPRVVGKHPDTGVDITADYGRYGPYLKMDKSNARLIGPATPLTVTVDEAVELLSKSKKGSSELKTLGKHPDTGEELVLKEGRYGPYISDGKLNAALRSGNDPNAITLEEAVELINLKRAAPKRKKPRKKRRKKK